MVIGSRKVDERDGGNSVADRNPRVTATTFLERLPQLLDGLRKLGFSVGVEQHLAIDELLIGLATRKSFPLDDPTVFGRLICPLFAKSPLQQEIFAGYFKDWLRQLPTTESDKEESFSLWLPEEKTEAGLNSGREDSGPLQRRYRYIEWLIVLFVAIGFVVIAIWGINRSLHPEPVHIVTQAEPGNVNVPPPAAPELSVTPSQPQAHRTKARGPKIELELVRAALGGIALSLLLLGFLRWRDNIYLQRKLASAIPKTGSLPLRVPAAALFKSNFVARTSYDLRRTRLVNQDRLDPEATVQASVRAGGFLTPVSFRQRVMPEYLVLIDRRNSLDQSTALTESLLARVAEDGVRLSIYYFDRAANFCFPRVARTERAIRSVSIDELVDRYSDSRLLVFADPVNILRPGSRYPQYWIQRLAEWESPALFVRRSDELARLVHDVLRMLGFSIFPATDKGLRSYVDFVNEWKSEELGRSEIVVPRFQTLPDILENESTWLGHREPDPSRVDSMLAGLEGTCGTASFLCLSACAIYPEIKWKLTSYLVREICRTEAFDESPEDLLGRLSVLPWFRYARMPDWLRLRLISSLDPKQEKMIRHLVGDLFLSASDAKIDGRTIFQIASQDPWFRSRVLRIFLRRKSGSEVNARSVGDPLHDYVFATFMRNGLSFRLPKAVQHLVRASHLDSLWGNIRQFILSLVGALTKAWRPITERKSSRLESSASESKAKKTDLSNENRRKAVIYAGRACVFFLLTFGLWWLLLAFARKPPQFSLSGYLFYIILLLIGLAAGGTLSSALRSYAQYTRKELGGLLQLGGPIVAFGAAVIAGFVLVPTGGTFSLTVLVHGTELAALSVQTEPSGASILLDGKPPQVPPNTFTHVPFGAHQLSATLDNYEPIKQDIQVGRGMSPDIHLQLKQVQEIAALSVQTEPSGASILLDGKPPQSSLNTFIHVPFGEHQLTATLDGYVPTKQDIEVREGMDPQVHLELKPLQEIAALSVIIEPAGASILLDGKPPQEPPNTFTHVPFGMHRLTATLEGYLPVNQDLEISETTSPKIGLKLQSATRTR